MSKTSLKTTAPPPCPESRGRSGPGPHAHGPHPARLPPQPPLPWSRRHGLAALHTRVGAELVKALWGSSGGRPARTLSLQVVSAVVAVELLSHGAYFIAGRTWVGVNRRDKEPRVRLSVPEGPREANSWDPGNRHLTKTPATKASCRESLTLWKGARLTSKGRAGIWAGWEEAGLYQRTHCSGSSCRW